MVLGIFSDVFHGQLFLMLEAMNRFMLGAVVHINAPDILHFEMCIRDRYLDVLKEHFNMEMASEFLVMASWLMHLKSKRLLPKQEKEEEEEITEEELARRLAQYKKYRDATPEITERYRCLLYTSRACIYFCGGSGACAGGS